MADLEVCFREQTPVYPRESNELAWTRVGGQSGKKELLRVDVAYQLPDMPLSAIRYAQALQGIQEALVRVERAMH